MLLNYIIRFFIYICTEQRFVRMFDTYNYLKMKTYLFLFGLMFPLTICSQSRLRTYNMEKNSNDLHLESKNYYEPNNDWIHQINLIDDSIFEFRSIPSVSCLSWKEFRGKYSIQNDTIIFIDKYHLWKPEMEFKTESDDKKLAYLFKFKYNKKENLVGEKVKITFFYDYRSKLKKIRKKFRISSDQTIEIQYDKIENHNKLYGFRIEFDSNDISISNDFSTYNLNDKAKKIPNIISINIVSISKKQEIIRTTKGIINENDITVFSVNSKTSLEEFSGFLFFKTKYYRTDN